MINKENKAGRVNLPGSVPSSIVADYDLSSKWVSISERMNDHRRRGEANLLNEELGAAAQKDKGSPLEPFFHLWHADNLCIEGSYREALKIYENSIKTAGKPGSFHPQINMLPHALDQFAKAASYSGNTAEALSAWKQLAGLPDKDEVSMLSAAKYFEGIHQLQEAAFFYNAAGGSTSLSTSPTTAQFAKRALLRMEGKELFYPSAAQLKDLLITALAEKNIPQLEKMLSASHCSITLGAGHLHFIEDEFRANLIAELVMGNGEVSRSQMGMGEKYYFYMDGFKGKLLRGEVGFLITRSAYGWQWTGVILPNPPNELLNDNGNGPIFAANNIPLPFPIKAPWPAGISFMAGGLSLYILQQAEILSLLALPWPAGPIAAAALTEFYAALETGFGVRGFYYNGGSTHDNDDYYAIDFSRYKRFVPYYNVSGGTPVLAVADGVVTSLRSNISSGDSSNPNYVRVDHNDPVTNLPRYYSRYLHLSGPSQLNVSMGSNVLMGYQLGKMNDTGTSVIDHLHFSLHDMNNNNQSIKPSPMDGTTLGDYDSGAIVMSTNVLRVPPTEIYPTNFQSKHFLVLPAPNFQSPSNINFRITLTGVAVIDNFKGATNGDWHKANVHLSAYDMEMNKVLNRVTPLLPSLPPNNPDGTWPSWAFAPLQWTVYASFNSVYNAGASVNAGYEIDDWKLVSGDRMVRPSGTIKVFEGIDVDLSVRDRDGQINKMGYKVNLYGYFHIVWNSPIY